MESTTTLQHCKEVIVYPTNPPGAPLTGATTITVGGAAGDGSVQVTTTPPGSTQPSVLTGAATPPFDGTPVTEIRMHYFANPGRPQSVPVTVQSGP